MNKELEALQEVRQQLTYYKEYAKEKLPTKAEQIDASCEEELNLIKTTIKEKKQQDQIINTIKEIIRFNAPEPEFEVDEDGSLRSIFGRVYLELKREITNNERELFRNWILETCFPKEFKALQIIKDKNVNVRAFKKVLLMEQNDDVKLRSYNSQNHRYEDDLTQEEFDLLKDVLYNNRYEDKGVE